jgi:integrase
MNGRALSPRRTVYLIASLSGLRRKELRRLEKRDCTPTGEKATWHLRPEIDKAGRGDKIPMLPECAEILLPIWESAPTPTSRLFKRISHTSVLHNDLKRVGIPRQDERGRWADFHSFRYTFCTFVGKKLPIQKVKMLMRQSTIQLTADLYTDLGLEEIGENVWTLPRHIQKTA